jgi:hypothetical protein
LEVNLQTIAEKVEALRTVLPLLHIHHPSFRSCIQYERAPSGEAPPPPDPCATRECGTCLVRLGLEKGKCPPERWEKIGRYYSIRYRTGAIEQALDELYNQSPALAQSVYYEYVEPWTEFNPGNRAKWSEAGLHFLATYIRGDIPFHSPDVLHEPWRREARKLHAEGLSIRQITRRLGRAYTSVRAAIHNVSLIHGRLRRTA